MSYKKLVSLFAVSALALGACGADDAEEAATDDTEETEEVEETEEGSTQDLIEQAKGDSGEAFPEYGMTVSGNWTEEGYSIGHPAGEAAVIPVEVVTEKEAYNVYLLEDGVISEVVSDEAAVEFTVENPSEDIEYHVGISPDDLGSEGDEVSVDDFARFEKVVFEVVEPAAEE